MTRPILMLTIVLSLSGCALRGRLFPAAPLTEGAPCQLPPSVTKEQLVSHLNKNIQGSTTSSGLASWRAMNCKITATGMPPGFSASAVVAVEAPRNFRLRVSEPITRAEALDMGSNRDKFWFWAKDAQPQQVITVNHEDLSSAQQYLQIPFHPDWLMEVLGVIPIEADKFTLQRGRADAPTYELVSETISSTGEATKKVIRVDACHGIIREHALYDSRGVLIARAALADHRIDPTTKLIVPQVVSFDWPSMQQSMKMDFGKIELNPPQMPAQVWQIPQKSGAPEVDLSLMLSGGGETGPSMYGVGSPFGAMPPAEASQMPPSAHQPIESRHPPMPTSDETEIRWDDVQASDASTDEDAAVETAAGVSRVQLTQPAIRPVSDSEPPAEYSPAASQSSSAPRPQGRALWRWQDR